MTIVTAILQQRPAVQQPQRKFLAVGFATILALRGRVNFRNPRRSCEYSERTMARQFRAAFAWPDFHQRVLTTALDSRSDLSSASEASFLPKSGKQTFGRGHFFDGCANRAERGLEILPLAVVEVRRRGAFTLAVGQRPPSADAATSGQEAEETRVDFSKQQLRAQRQRLPQRGKYHGGDGYCAKKKDMDAVVALKLHPLTKLRGDANCLFLSPGPHPKRRGSKRQYAGKVHFHDLHRFESLGTRAKAHQVPLYTAIVWHVSLKRKLRVVVLVNRKAPHKPRYLVLASPEVAVDGRKLVACYGARFQLEFLLRDSKQVPGLADCQARAAAALAFHCNASLATLNLARAQDVRASPDHSAQVFSMASRKQCQFTARLLD